MNIKKNLILATISLASANAHAQDYVKTAQFNFGKLLETDTISFRLEYPEYEKLSSASVKQLQAQGFEAQNEVDFHITRSISRGDIIADVTYIPVVKRHNAWYAIKTIRCNPPFKAPRSRMPHVAYSKPQLMYTNLSATPSNLCWPKANGLKCMWTRKAYTNLPTSNSKVQDLPTRRK